MWRAVLLAGLACYVTKLAGLSLPPRLMEDPRLRRIAALLPVALLMALTATQAFATGNRLVLDARAAGLAAAVCALLLRAPFLVVIGSAAGVAALIRALG